MKFQCAGCQGVVETDFDDEYVSCGHCGAVCHVPKGMESGVVIDDFVILKLLGQGGMGDVYLAHQFSLDRHVALKILKSDLCENEKFKEDFIREARSVASLNNSKIIQAFKVGEEDSILFFAMEYVEGQNLQDILKNEGALDELRVLDIALDVVEALGYAWEKKKLVHRDIKPENIMIAHDGHAKVMDLGLSTSAGNLNDDGDTISGTPQYISPEQILGDDIDIRTDFYCLGASLYHLLSGSYPFDGNLQEMVRKHIQEPPTSLKKRCPDVSGHTVKIIHRMMSKRPDERPSSSALLTKEIEHSKKLLLDHLHGKKHFSVASDRVASVTTATQRIKRPKKQNTVLVAVGVMLFLLIFGFAIVKMSWSGQAAESRKDSFDKVVASAPVKEKWLAGLNYAVYEKEIKQVADFNRLSPDHLGSVASLTVDGLKGRSENIGVVFSGYVRFPHSETYRFHLSANDQCSIEIDNKSVISHTLGKATSVVNIPLDKGIHKIKVMFIQKTKDKDLKLYVESVSVNKKLLPNDWLLRKEQAENLESDSVEVQLPEETVSLEQKVKPSVESLPNIRGLICRTYSSKTAFTKLLKVADSKIERTYFIPYLNISLHNEEYVSYEGFVKLLKDADYYFKIGSQREVYFELDGKTLLNLEKPKEVKVPLNKGFYPFKIFFKAGKDVPLFQYKFDKSNYKNFGFNQIYRNEAKKLKVEFYQNHSDLSRMSKIKPSKIVYMEKIHFKQFPFSEDYSMRTKGSIYISKPGKYTFQLGAHDKAELSIGSQLVNLRIGAKTDKKLSQTVELAIGFYDYTLKYYQKTRAKVLNLNVEFEGKSAGNINNFTVR